MILMTGSMNLSSGQQFFPDTGAVAIAQRCRDIQSNLSVINISLRPGHEDLATLSYLRLEQGAQILSVYITNGETEESDAADLFPYEIAVIRRSEATSALALLESEVHFMNMPDIAGTATSDEIQQQWPRDTMVIRLIRLIGQFKPDLILLSSNNSADETLLYDTVIKNLLTAIRELSKQKSENKLVKELGLDPWDVERVAIRDTAKSGLAVPLTSLHPILKKTYEKIGEEVSLCYRSLFAQREMWKNRYGHQYKIIKPKKGLRISKLDAHFTGAVPQTLKVLDQNIRTTLSRIINKKSNPKSYVISLIPLLAAVDKAIVGTEESRPRERRIVLNWKAGLEKLRTALLGITVAYDLSYSLLVERQLVEFRIDSVINMPKGGETTLLFPIVNQGSDCE